MITFAIDEEKSIILADRIDALISNLYNDPNIEGVYIVSYIVNHQPFRDIDYPLGEEDGVNINMVILLKEAKDVVLSEEMEYLLNTSKEETSVNIFISTRSISLYDIDDPYINNSFINELYNGTILIDRFGVLNKIQNKAEYTKNVRDYENKVEYSPELNIRKK